MNNVRLLQGDCRDVLKTLPDNSVDSIVTDPPYGLSFMGKKWDYDVPSVDIWKECLRVLKPGGHLLAFAGTRTQHRMACRIEDAGFDIRDMIAWVYGSGFPKSHNLDGDKQGWGTALKPALEPITVARKPLIGTVADNVQTFGCGALNIDGCRVETLDSLNGGAYSENRKPSTSEWVAHGGTIHNSTGEAYTQPTGRWPANFIHDGSEEVLECFPKTVTKSSGESGSKSMGALGKNGKYGTFALDVKAANAGGLGDEGTPARFFYCPKASKRDRGEVNTHPTVKPTALMRYLCRLVTPPNGTVLDPFNGSGSTGKGAVLEGFSYIGIEREAEHIETSKGRIAFAETQRALPTQMSLI